MPLRPSRLAGAISRRRFLQTLPGILVAGNGLVHSGPSLINSAEAGTPKPAAPLFVSIPPSTSGIHWKHTSGRSWSSYLPETTGAGCAFFDYDNDGWMDIYLVNSGKCDFFDPNPPLRNALYKNNRDGTFTDVTEEAGLLGGGYGMGVAIGDYDGDGWPDLYLTQYGRSILYHNEGNGKFVDVTSKAGVAAPGWSSSAVWFDYDNDGRLDLFVCRFVEFSKEKNLFCGDPTTGKGHYCIPRVYSPSPSWLFHNNGDGTFTDVSKESGIADQVGKAWGVVATDINNDGRMDLFVANDTVPNFLFANRGHGKFEEIGVEAGVAYDEGGRPRSGMGVDSADYDQDGWMDLFLTNIDHEKYSVYHNNHDESFKDEAAATGIGTRTFLMSGWGVKFFDFDNDGNVDLFIANGHPDDTVQERYKDVPYEMPLLLFRNTGGGAEHAFENVGTILDQPLAARGMAIGDFDNDGAVDLLVAVNNGAPVLLRNVATAGNHWLGVRLVGKKANRDAIGALITYQAGDLKRHVFKVGGGSYLSSHDPRVVLGLGPRTRLDWVEVKWPQPSGLVERFVDLGIDRYVTIEEGSGRPVAK